MKLSDRFKDPTSILVILAAAFVAGFLTGRMVKASDGGVVVVEEKVADDR